MLLWILFALMSGAAIYSIKARSPIHSITLAPIALLALLLYLAVGSPEIPAQPQSQRLAQQNFHPHALAARLENRLIENPADAQAWQTLAALYTSSETSPKPPKPIAAPISSAPIKSKISSASPKPKSSNSRDSSIKKQSICCSALMLKMPQTSTLYISSPPPQSKMAKHAKPNSSFGAPNTSQRKKNRTKIKIGSTSSKNN